MKYMSVVDVILGINISKTYERQSLFQSHYIEAILETFKAYDDNPVKISEDKVYTQSKILVKISYNWNIYASQAV